MTANKAVDLVRHAGRDKRDWRRTVWADSPAPAEADGGVGALLRSDEPDPAFVLEVADRLDWLLALVRADRAPGLLANSALRNGLDGCREPRGFAGHRGPVFGAWFGDRGRKVATAGADGTARVWDAATGRPLVTVTHPALVRAVLSPDGRRLLTGGGAGNQPARVWDAETAAGLAVFRGHDAAVRCGDPTAAGVRLVTAGADGTVRLWEEAGGRWPGCGDRGGRSRRCGSPRPAGTSSSAAGRRSGCRTWTPPRTARDRLPRAFTDVERGRYDVPDD